MQTNHMWFIWFHLIFLSGILFLSTYYEDLVQMKPSSIKLKSKYLFFFFFYWGAAIFFTRSNLFSWTVELLILQGVLPQQCFEFIMNNSVSHNSFFFSFCFKFRINLLYKKKIKTYLKEESPLLIEISSEKK